MKTSISLDKSSLRKKIIPLVLLLQLAILCLTQNVEQSFAIEPPFKIVTTTGMIADVVKEVAGNRVQISQLIASGVDPHLYKPTRSDIALLNTADIVFYNGLILEGKMTDVLIRIATSGKKVFAVTDLIPLEYLLEPKEFQGHYDPHVWMDPSAWAKTVVAIRDKLSEFDNEGKAFYETNSNTYLAKLAALDAYAQKVTASIPANARILVTAHDAFNYFGRRYNFQVVGIQGISTESEAGVKDIEKIVNLLVEHKVKSVFIESTVSARNVEALIEGAQAKGQKVTIGGQLFSDAMGTANTYEGTYLGMIDHNVTTIVNALGGQCPKTGMDGKLTSIKE